LNSSLRPAAYLLVMLPALSLFSYSQVKVTVNLNTGLAATPAFKFAEVPPPTRDNAATGAKLLLVDGEIDPGSAGLGALTDGILPVEADDPHSNFFFTAGGQGGRVRMDLGAVREILQVNTYSWHPDSRGPQVYKLYASDGTDPKFNAAPKNDLDPSANGWKLIATVDTRDSQGEGGGQYGVSITDAKGTLGKFRYLLFDCFETEDLDNWGNTFYSEIDVQAKK